LIDNKICSSPLKEKSCEPIEEQIRRASIYSDNSLNKNKSSKALKLLMLGESGVGKTSLLLKFVNKTFKESYLSTIGMDFMRKKIIIDNNEIQLNIWDSAGQERFRTLVPSYFRNTDGLIIVYDITDEKSYENVN